MKDSTRATPWRLALRIVALLCWLVSVIWFLSAPGFEPLLAFLAGVASMLGSSAAQMPVVEIKPLSKVTLAQLRGRLGQGGTVQFVDRSAVGVGDLRAHGRVVITGRMKLGKTREAIELIARAIDGGQVREGRIYELGPACRLLDTNILASALRSSLPPEEPALLFLDDLPQHYFGEALEKLEQALNVFHECKTVYVVATARTDQLTPAHQYWLQHWRFLDVPLPGLVESEINQLVNKAAPVFDLLVDDSARGILVSRGDGTPELILASLRRLRADGVRQVDGALADRAIHKSLSEAWAETRRYVEEREQATRPLLEALATFHAAGVNAYTPLVLGYATRKWRRRHHVLRGLCLRTSLLRALHYLGDFDIIDQGRIIAYPDIAVDGWLPVEDTRNHLELFLRQHRHMLHRWGLRRFNSDALEQSSALVELAILSQLEHDYETAIQLYSVALRVLPHHFVFNARGVAYAFLNSLEDAIEDFYRALELKSEFAPAHYNLGVTFSVQGKPIDAIAEMSQAVTIEPKFAAAFSNRGAFYAEQGQYGQALHDLNHAIELEPYFALAYLGRGRVHLRMKNLPEAIADFTRAVSLNSKLADAYAARGRAFLGQQQPEAAYADFEQLVELQPQHALAYLGMGMARAIQDEYAEAIDNYNHAIELDPYLTEALLSRAVVYYTQGESQLAIADYSRAIELDPENAQAYAQRGSVYGVLQQELEAMNDFTTALRLDPSLAEAYVGRGNCYRERGNLALAIADYTAAIELDPHLAIAYYNRGNAYREEGALEQADSDYTQAIELNPRDSESYYKRALVRHDSGNLQSAIADYSQVVELDPDNALAYFNRGLANGECDGLSAAIADFTEVIRLNPQDEEAYYNRGLAHRKCGEIDEALDDYSRAIRINPRFAGAYKNRAIVHTMKKNLNLARADIDQAIVLNPGDAANYGNRGSLLLDEGDIEGAIADLDRAIALDPQYAMAYFSRGRAHLANRDRQKATADFSTVLQLEETSLWQGASSALRLLHEQY